MDKEELASKIRILRDSLGYSQEKLAAEAGIDRRSLQRIENGDGSPNLDTLWAIGTALNRKLIIEFGQTKPSSAEFVANTPELFASIDRRLADLQARIQSSHDAPLPQMNQGEGNLTKEESELLRLFRGASPGARATVLKGLRHLPAIDDRKAPARRKRLD